MGDWERHAAEAALLLWRAIPARNDTVGGLVVSDLGTTGGTPYVVADVGGEARRMAYLPPHAIRVGRPIFAERASAAPDAPWLVVATNYQVDPRMFGVVAGTGSTLGVGATSAAAATDWAAGMADADSAEYGERGAALPLILGRVADE